MTMENEELELKELEAELAALEEKETVVEPPKKPTRRRRSVTENLEEPVKVETTPVVEPKPVPTPTPEPKSEPKLPSGRVSKVHSLRPSKPQKNGPQRGVRNRG